MAEMRFETKAVKAVSASKSLRTTVPEVVVQFLGIEEGSTLAWVLDPVSGSLKVEVASGGKKSSRRR